MQSCPRTHGARIKHHDYILDHLVICSLRPSTGGTCPVDTLGYDSFGTRCSVLVSGRQTGGDGMDQTAQWNAKRRVWVCCVDLKRSLVSVKCQLADRISTAVPAAPRFGYHVTLNPHRRVEVLGSMAGSCGWAGVQSKLTRLQKSKPRAK